MPEIRSFFREILERLDDVGPGKLTEAVEYWTSYPEELIASVFDHRRGGVTSAPLLADSLRSAIGLFPEDDAGETCRTWENCIGNQTVTPLKLVTPTSLAELINHIKHARAAKLKVKAVGSGQSFSDVVQTTGTLIDTTELCGVLPLDPKLLRENAEPATLFRVQAGIKLRHLNEALWEAGLSLPNMTGYAGLALAGALSTAAHGTGIKLPPLCDMVASVDLVTADGSVVRVEPVNGITHPAAFAAMHPDKLLKQDDDWFRSVVVGLGCMGVVYALTLRVLPRFWLKEERTIQKWSELRHEIHTALLENDHYEVLINPYSTDGDHTCLVTRRNRVPEPEAFSDWLQHRQIIPAILSSSPLVESALVSFLNLCPSLTPALIDQAMGTLVNEYTDRSYRVLDLGPVNKEKVYSAEVALPMDRSIEAVDRIFALASEAAKVAEIFQNSPFSLRFVAASQHYLAMSHGAPRCMIEMPILMGTRGALEVLARFEYAMAELGGRSHWGELQQIIGPGVDVLYPEVNRWKAVRRRIDPKGMFDNAFTSRTGLGGHGGTSHGSVEAMSHDVYDKKVLPLDPEGVIAIKRDVREVLVGASAERMMHAFAETLQTPGRMFGMIEVLRSADKLGCPFSVGERFQGRYSIDEATYASITKLQGALGEGLTQIVKALDLVFDPVLDLIENQLLSDYGEIVELTLDPPPGEPRRLRYVYLEGTPIAGSLTIECHAMGKDHCRFTQISEYQEIGLDVMLAFGTEVLKMHSQVFYEEVKQSAELIGAPILGTDIPAAYRRAEHDEALPV